MKADLILTSCQHPSSVCVRSVSTELKLRGGSRQKNKVPGRCEKNPERKKPVLSGIEMRECVTE